jgi:hypothetical protein
VLPLRRISFVIDDRIEKALKELGPRLNIGQFLRAAVHFYLESYENIKNIDARLALIEKKISQVATPKSECTNYTDRAEQGKRTYDRSKAIDRILNMGKNTNQEGNT